MNKFKFIFISMALSACIPTQGGNTNLSDCFNYFEVQNHKLIPKYCSDQKDLRLFIKNDYQISVPGNLFKIENSPEEIVFESKISDEPTLQDYYLEVKHVSSNCTPELTGASSIQKIEDTNGETRWGKVDFFEKYAGEGGTIDYEGDRPLCAGPSSARNRYAFCSEKNGKTIVICMHQMQDDPKLAEQIFSSFRWTK